jgi:hypothetical protein
MHFSRLEIIMAGRITHNFVQYADNPRPSRNVPVPPTNIVLTYRYADSLTDALHRIVLEHDTPDLDAKLAALLDHFLGKPTPDEHGNLAGNDNDTIKAKYRSGGTASYFAITQEYA